MKRLSRRQEWLAFAILVLVLIAVFALWNPVAGDQTRPPEAEGKSYVDLDQIDPDDTVVKFDDKWWYVNQTSGELELIGGDP